jgi:hypothetical protein
MLAFTDSALAHVMIAATLSTLVLSAASAPAAEMKVTKRVGDVGHIEISGPIGPADDVTF